MVQHCLCQTNKSKPGQQNSLQISHLSNVYFIYETPFTRNTHNLILKNYISQAVLEGIALPEVRLRAL